MTSPSLPHVIGRTISRFLFQSVIYLRNLPPDKGGPPFLPEFQAMSVYMVLLVLVPSPPYVATRRRELLPRGFTLTLFGRSVLCYGFHKITPICDFHSRMPFPVRTFLSRKFLPVISSSLLVPHILTTERLLRYSSAAFLEIPRHNFPRATDRSTYIISYNRACALVCRFVS